MNDLIVKYGHGMPEIYFVSFTVIASLILINVLVAVILDNFSDIVNSNDALVTEADLESFGAVWGN